MDRCSSQTRTSSESSVSTRGESPELVPWDLPKIESMPTEWTDEKHSLYLKSMEASFVNQLYNSMELLDQQFQKEMSDPKLSYQVHCNTCSPSGQFKVLRGACWQKINFRRPDLQVNIANQPHGRPISPWIQHFRAARKCHVPLQESAASQRQATNLSGKKAMSGATSTCSKHSFLCRYHSRRHDLVDGNTEVSDQNFVDEDVKSAKTTSTCSSKRIKTQTASASNNDQVVPYGKPPVAEDITGKCDSTAT